MTYRDVLSFRDYRLLFSGQVLSQLGDAIYEVGIVWLVYQMTASPAALGWLALCQSVPFLVCGLLAGAYADRWDRRRTMLVSDFVRGLAVLYLALRYSLGSLTVAEVCAVAAVLTTARAFFHPAMRAILPQMMPREHLLLANSLSETAKRVCKIGGMMLGGVLMANAKGEGILLFNAATFFLSLVTVWFMKTRTERVPAVANQRSVLRDIRAAFGEVARHSQVRSAILLSSLGLILSAGLIKIGLPLLAGEVLQAEGDVYGLLMACFSVGMFTSAALMKRLVRLPVVRLVQVGWLVYGLTFVLLSFTSSVWLACLLVALIGLAHFLTDIPVTTLIQQQMPIQRMSACQSIWATASFGSESLSVAVTGALLGMLPLLITMPVAGVILSVLGVVPMIKWGKDGQNALDRGTMTK